MTLSVLLLVASLALLVLEVFVVSFGAITAIAIACGIGSVLTAFGESAILGWTMVSVLVVAGPLCVWGAFRVLPRLPFARGFYLRPPDLTREERFAAAAPHDELVGALGTAASPLRPAGTAIFDAGPAHVVTTGGMLPKGARVRVVSVTGNRIVVERAE